MYTLYWSPRTGAFPPDAVLSLANVTFQRQRVKQTNMRVDDPAFEKVSPMNQIPAIVMPDGTVMCESVAISLTLAERHPEADVLPPNASPERAYVYRWLMHMLCNLYETDLRHSYPDRYTSDPNGIEGVREAAASRWAKGFDVIEAELGDGPWFMGAQFTLLDIYLAATVCWHFDTPWLLRRVPKIRAICANVRRLEPLAPLFELYELGDLDELVLS